MNKQIQQLIANLSHDADLLENANPLDLFKAGEQRSLRYAIERLEAILASASSENGSEATQTPINGTYDDGYDAGFQACLKEMR